MPRKPSARVVLNRSKLHEVTLAVADGLFEVGRTIEEIASEQAPDSPYDPYPTGEGLPKQGGVIAEVDGQKVAGWSRRGSQPKKPRAARGGKGALVIVGFGFPGRFAHNGTVRHGGDPFLASARDQVVPHAIDIMRPIVEPKLKAL